VRVRNRLGRASPDATRDSGPLTVAVSLAVVHSGAIMASRMTHGPIPLLCAISALLVPVAGSQAADPEQEIRALEERRIGAILKGDTAFLETHFADDYTAIRGDGKLTTKKQEIESFRAGITKYESIDEHELVIRIYGDTAIANARSTIRATINGRPYSGDVRNTRVWVRQRGSWKLVTFQATRVATASQ